MQLRVSLKGEDIEFVARNEDPDGISWGADIGIGASVG